MIQGAIELLTATHLSGWVLEDSARDQPLEVRVLLDRAEIARAVADTFRQDLKDAGLGSGRHGFSAAIPGSVPPEARARMEVRAVDHVGRFRSLPWLEVARPLHFTGPTHDDEARPVFILGSPRSGTSAMAAALRESTRYDGHAEGHLLPLLPHLIGSVSQYYHDQGPSVSAWTTLATVPQTDVEARLRGLFIALARARFDTVFWIDKTPSNHMIIHASMFAAMWPNARFIFMKRRAIENVASRLRKFPDWLFEDHCRDWADAMYLWSTVRDTLGERAREVDQLTLARQPEQIALELASFLELSPEEQSAFSAALSRQRSEQTGSRIDGTSALSLTGWSPEQQVAFRRLCGPAMRQYGYSEDAEYFG